MKIAFFTDSYAPEINGVTNTLSKLGSYLDKRHIQQLVIAPDYDGDNPCLDSEYRTVHRYRGITTALSPKSRLAFPPFWEINGMLDNFKPDIIHVTTEFGIGFRGMRYALDRDIPLVMSYHTDYCKYLKYHNLELMQPVIKNYLDWYYSFPDRILVPSRNTFAELQKKGYRNLDIWSRGIDISCFNPKYRNENLRKTLAGDKFIFLYVGRLSAEKNLDMLLDAAAEIERRFPGRAQFVFTGDGPYAEKIKNSPAANLVFTGFKRGEELSEIYASADCFAFPSGTETFGNVVLEAMASGLPVAAVGSGGVTDFLSHRHNALLCAPDNREAFTNNLINIMENEKLRGILSENAQKTARLRDWDSIFDNLVDVYVDTIVEFRRQTAQLAA
jgi:glycosyltransferase involved in cell wall biosynthesis